MSLPLSRFIPSLLWLILALFPSPLFAQTLTRSAGEFSIIGTQPGDQLWPQLALNPDGGYILWQDNGLDGRGLSIGALHLNNRLIPDRDPFIVNHTTAGDQERPHAALLSNGRTVVVWQGGKLGFQRIYARFIDPDGTFLTGDVPVGEHTISGTRKWKANRWIWVQNKLKRQRLQHQRTIRHVAEANREPKVVALPDGGAAVIYCGVRKTVTNATDWIPQFTMRNRKFFTNSVQKTVTTQIDRMQEVLLQRLSASGEPIGEEITVNQYSDFNQHSPAVALLPDGNLIVVWISEHEFPYPLAATIESALPRVGAAKSLALGRILGENRVVLTGRIITPDGQPLSDEFRLDGQGPAVCSHPDVLTFQDGSFTVAWSQRATPVNIGWDIMARPFAADGTPVADAARVNAFHGGDQAGPKMVHANGIQFVLWTSMTQDESREGVFGRLLSGGLPVGEEIPVNLTTLHSQRHPAVVYHNGQLVTAWASYSGVADAMELVATKFIVSGTLAQNGDSSGLATEASIVGRKGMPATTEPVPSSVAEASSTSPPDPAAIRIALQTMGAKLTLTWNTLADAAYQVQISADLKTWTPAGSERLGTGTTDSVRFETGPGATFYRIKRIR